MTDRRKQELAMIHVAKKQLAIDDETYRAILRSVGNVETAADLDGRGRHAVIEHFKSKGFQTRKAGRSRPADGRGPLVSKIRAMLAAAARSDEYADGVAKRMFKVDRFEWCDPQQLRKIVAALVYDSKRRSTAK